MSDETQEWIRTRLATLKKQAGFAFNYDLFISILLCLISGRNKHLVLTAPPDRLKEISQMAAQISRCIFGLTTATTTCTPEQTRADLIDVLFDLREEVDAGRHEHTSRARTTAQQASLQKPRPSTHTLNFNRSYDVQADSSQQVQSGKTSLKVFSNTHMDETNSMYTPPVNPVDFNLRKRDNRSPFNLNRVNPSTPSGYATSISHRELLMSRNRKEKAHWNTLNAVPTRISQTVVVQDLDKSHESVQALLLELIVTEELRISNVKYNVPKPLFIIIAVLPHGYNRLAVSSHLMDRFFVSYSFDEDMFPQPPQQPNPSVGRLQNHRRFALMKYEEIKSLSEKASKVHVNIDINRYIRDIVVGVRTHPRVKGGLTARCSQDLLTVVKSLATLFGADFLTPDIVNIAVAKVLSHRLHLLAISETDDQMEREDMNSKLPMNIVEEIIKVICVPV